MILIALNDDPTGSEPRQYKTWNEFFAQVDDAHEIEARVMCGASFSDDLLVATAWRTVEILGMYTEYLDEIDDEKLAEAAHRSAHMSELL